MFFKRLKERTHHFFVKKSKRLHQQISTSNKNDTIHNLLVITDDFSKKEAIKKELQLIFNPSKYNIEIVIFQYKKSKKKECNNCIYPSDFGWLGGILFEKSNKILTKKHDLLINYCKIDYIYINTLLLHCKIAFKVGFSQINNPSYDLLINCDTNDIALFTNELNKYLSVLNKLQ